MRAVKHHSRNLLYRQTLRKVCSAYFSWQTPVFVRIQNTVAVHVLEGISLVLQDGDSGSRSISKGLSPFLGYEAVTFLCSSFVPFLTGT